VAALDQLPQVKAKWRTCDTLHYVLPKAGEETLIDGAINRESSLPKVSEDMKMPG
jgi:hypothetical protein